MWLNGPTQWEDHKIGRKHKKHTSMTPKSALPPPLGITIGISTSGPSDHCFSGFHRWDVTRILEGALQW